jgi:hypothetical protein
MSGLTPRPAFTDVNREMAVVEVGPSTLTADDILSQVKRFTLLKPTGDELADRKRVIEPIVQARLMLLEAEARGLEDEALRRQLQRMERETLVRELEDVEIRQKLVQDPERVDEAVRRASLVLYLRGLETSTPAEAESLRQRVLAGESLADLARARGGTDSLPPLYWGEGGPALEEVAYRLRPGEIGGPFALAEGRWQLVLLDSVATRAADPESLRTAVVNALDFDAFNRGQIAFLKEMKAKLRQTVIDSTVDLFLARLKAWDAAGAPDHPDRGGGDRFGFTAAERALPMFTYDGGQFTIGDYSDYMADQPAARVRQRTERERVDQDLDQYFRHHAYADVARARSYLEISGSARALERRRERALIQKLYAAEVALKEPPMEAELRAHYVAHPERYEPARAESFEEARERVTADLVAQREEERYATLIARLKESYPIVYHDDALRRLPFDVSSLPSEPRE